MPLATWVAAPDDRPAPDLPACDTHAGLHRQSLDHPDRFWSREAERLYWHTPPRQICDFSRPPFARWFVGGETNLCYNAVDRHLEERADQLALVNVSSETGTERTFTYRELHREVNRVAAMLRTLGVGRGDRVIIYMPMVAEAVFAMLACVRLGAIHSVVFGGFAAHSLASRIDDARPAVVITADAGIRGGKVIPYKPLVDEAIRLAEHPPAHVILLDRGLVVDRTHVAGRDHDYATLREQHLDAEVPVVWLESSEPSYILYTSGTTGKPKGVQRDTGGYAVALATSMDYIYGAKPGEVYFSTSDIGWVVGHSYIVYGPLLTGMTTIVYEGTPLNPDPAIWWKLVEQYRVNLMFSSPTGVRVLKKQDERYLHQHDVSSLRALYLAGEPLDEPTARWISEALDVEIVDNYWQTETGWPILTRCQGVEKPPGKFGAAGLPVYGYRMKLVHEETGAEVGTDEKGLLCVVPPLPPGCLTTVWGNDERFLASYFGATKELLYSTFDWARRDADGYYFILGRSDDVINVAGHRLGTREIEEAICCHPAVVEAAVVGPADEVKGQVPIAFAVLKDARQVADAWQRSQLEQDIQRTVDHEVGPLARPARVYFVPLLPKTRSGKVLRRAILALAEGRDPGDLTTIEDAGVLEQLKAAMQ